MVHSPVLGLSLEELRASQLLSQLVAWVKCKTAAYATCKYVANWVKEHFGANGEVDDYVQGLECFSML